MKDSRDKKSEPDRYHFIKETIKEERKDKKHIFKKIIGISAGGFLFGVCAAVGFAAISPAALEKICSMHEKRTEINLTEEDAQGTETTEKEAQKADGDDPGKNGVRGTGTELTSREKELDQATSLLESYEETYDEVLLVSEEPRKALVRVCGIGDDEDLLDNTFVSYGDEQGIIFFEDENFYFILTGSKGLGKTVQQRVTFCNGSSVIAELCGVDTEMNLEVIRVSKSHVPEETRKAISVVALGNSHDSFQAKPVIAIGSPSGDPDAVIYGMVTSVSGKLNVSDWEFDLLATDMKGSPDGSGVLLDTSGKLIGVIVHIDGETTNIVRVVSLTQLRPLIEILANKENVRYLGIDGSSFSAIQKANMDVPDGIYVNGVESNSPAMTAGVKNGDIISAVGDTKVQNMQEYTKALQSLKKGQGVTLVLYRSSADGRYVEMKIKMTIDER